ncbi:MAG: caspase family protein [Candidatus Atribacteria bacterium]|nr:caspase family protein [Candidatus Atribacteria bacterium]
MSDSIFNYGYALIIGVAGDLRTTGNDAIALRELLIDEKYCAYPRDQVEHLVSVDATRDGILSSIERLQKKVIKKPKSTVIFYFSGHGIETPDYYLLPYDYNIYELSSTCISGKELTEQLMAIEAENLLILLDTCYAGGMVEFKHSPFPQVLLENVKKESGKVLIASSQKNQTSIIDGDNSIFTETILEALSGHGTSSRQDGRVYVDDVAMYVREQVSRRTKQKQQPFFDHTQTDNFVLAYYAGGRTSPNPLQINCREHEYDRESIRNLLIKGFSDSHLRQLCFYNPKFRPLHYRIGKSWGLADIINLLLEYAEQQELLDDLLEWAETENQAKYELYYPYK